MGGYEIPIDPHSPLLHLSKRAVSVVSEEDEAAFASAFNALEGGEVRREPPCVQCNVRYPREVLNTYGVCAACRQRATDAQRLQAYAPSARERWWLMPFLMLFGIVLLIATAQQCGEGCARRASGDVVADAPRTRIVIGQRMAPAAATSENPFVRTARDTAAREHTIAARWAVVGAIASAEALERELRDSEEAARPGDRYWSTRVHEVLIQLERARAHLGDVERIPAHEDGASSIVFPATEIVVPAARTAADSEGSTRGATSAHPDG